MSTEERIPEISDLIPSLKPQADEIATVARQLESLVEVQPEPVKHESNLALDKLSEEERDAVLKYKDIIDLNNQNFILLYGASAQKNISQFSDTALNSIKNKDLGEVGSMLTKLVVEIKDFDADSMPKKGFFGKIKMGKSWMEELKAKYNRVDVNIDKIVKSLEGHEVQLVKDITMLDQMYEINLRNYKELTLYIIAGKEKLKEERETTLVELMNKARASSDQIDVQIANDYASKLDRFEKKIHDLELTRMVSIQSAPQIRLIQNNDTLLVEKIQSSIVNTIPLWKSQMVLALGIANSQAAMEAQRSVTDMTNELLKKNAATLKMGSIEIAKESERGLIDIETLQKTNASLIETLTEVVKIQSNGKEQRRLAEEKLVQMEGELKNRLLEIRNATR